MESTPASFVREPLKAPRAGAIAGIVFSLLMGTSLVLVRVSVPASPVEAGTWLSGGWKTVRLALNLLPFAGVAFLWFIGVLRDRLAEREDRFFATVFLGSGLLFVSMLFSAGAVAGAMMVVYSSEAGRTAAPATYSFGRSVAYEVMNVYAMKMAGVFVMSTSTIALKTAIFRRWMAYLGFVLALLLLLGSTHLPWAPIVFPLFVLLISADILLANLGSASRAPDRRAGPPAREG